MKWAIIIAAAFAVSASHVEAQGVQKAGVEPSAYCRSAAQALFQSAGDAEITAVVQRCRRGDTIAVNAGSQGAVFAVGRLCDFSKAMVNVGGQVVCILGGERVIR